ncbi:MAG: hypothetical protein RLZZ171_1260 [Cyanobacteriota bacterium]|jgi:acetolactate synthase small subunit
MSKIFANPYYEALVNEKNGILERISEIKQQISFYLKSIKDLDAEQQHYARNTEYFFLQGLEREKHCLERRLISVRLSLSSKSKN